MVVPTTELVLAHEHPDDLAMTCQLIQTLSVTVARAQTSAASSTAKAGNAAS